MMKNMGTILRTENVFRVCCLYLGPRRDVFSLSHPRSVLGWMPGVARTRCPRFVMTQRFSLSGICFLFSYLGPFSLHMDKVVSISSKRLYISFTCKVGCAYNFYL